MKTFLLLLMTLSGLQNVISQSCTATISAGGPTSFCEGGNVVLTANASGGSGAWTQKANLGSLGRQNAVSFSIGNKGYLGTGLDGAACRNDFWEYDPTSNAWTQKANFGGGVRWHATGFSIGSKGYMGTGSDLSTGAKKDFWEYDPTTNEWIQKASFGGSAREGAKGFSIGSKGYLGTGFDPLTGYTSDFWEYDPSSNAWTQKADFFSSRYEAISFSIGNKGYLGFGGAAGGYANDLWEYDPSSNAWTQKAYFGGTIRGFSLGLNIGNKGYIGTGLDPRAGVYKNDFWEFDPNANTWIQKTNFGGSSRGFATGFSIGNKGYIGTGIDSSIYKNDLWEFDLGYTYLWSTGETTPTITVTSSGSYTVTITNNDGCSATSDALVVNVNPTPAMNTPTNQIVCNGIATSAIEFAGGEIDTTYSWTNDNTSIGLASSGTGNIVSFTAINTNSIAQIANIRVTPDYNGCTGTAKTFTFTINPTPAKPDVNVVNNCGNSVLSTIARSIVTARPIGNLLWSTGETTATITVITAGIYTVTQTIDGCTSAAASGTAAPIASPSTPVVNVENNYGNSVLSTTASGSLVWNTGETTSSITVTTAGTFTVTQTVNGCTSAAGSGIAAPKETPSTPEVNVVNNCGNSVLSTTASGSLLWNTGETTSSITVTTAGSYTVTQTVNGSTSAAGSGTAAPKESPSMPEINVVNNCGNSILSTLAAGTILWSTGAASSSITVITAGTYTVTQTVAGCVSTAGAAIAAPKALPSTPIVKVDNYCGSSILSTTSPGPLLWSNGSTRSSITVYQPGTYSVTLTQNGCTSAAGFGNAAPNKAPIITAANIIVSATLNDCNASVSFGSNVTVTGIPTPTVLYKIGDKIITSPYKFPVGSTSIRVIANNTCGTSLKTFLIKITDNQNPTIDCKPAAARTVRYSTYSVSGKEFNATASDNCGHLTLIYSLSGATVVPYKSKNTSLENVKLNIGTTTITWKATDESNLISTCNTIVTVKRADDNSLTVTLPIISNSLTKSEDIQKPVTLIAKAIPNPSVNYFTLELKSNKKESITIKVIDVAGRMIEKRTNIQANSTLQIGNHYAKGVYFAEIRQGREKVILQLIKEGN